MERCQLKGLAGDVCRGMKDCWLKQQFLGEKDQSIEEKKVIDIQLESLKRYKGCANIKDIRELLERKKQELNKKTS
jgi:hypothetical protein